MRTCCYNLKKSVHHICISLNMKISNNLINSVFKRYRASSSVSTGVNSVPDSSSPGQTVKEERETLAAWIPIGTFQKGILSHLTTSDIVRALAVLHMCSYDFFVERSFQMFNLSQKFGPVGDWILRRTFFNQFVGGDAVARMTEVVQSMQIRGLTLMVLPVLEEDIQDAKCSKEKYDDNLGSLLEIVSMTSSLENRMKPVLQLKLSAIMPANTLEQASRAIESKSNDQAGLTAKFVSDVANSIENPSSLKLNMESSDMVHFFDGISRADSLVKRAKNLGVNVLVDAEFYSCKPAISTIALALMVRYNGQGHVIGNTIQGYLKDAFTTIRTELKLITEEVGVNWYGKIVRGAYVDRERYLANKNGYPSPTWDTYEDTNVSYNRVIHHVLEHLSTSRKGSHLIVATHNERSIRLAAQAMKDLEISSQNKTVSFAQIFGMADYLSTPLVEQGYQVYKSTPYGPMGSVMPYLARRASENRSVMNGAREERSMLWKELKARMASS